jgi:predicted TPR repeat methyltransferase
VYTYLEKYAGRGRILDMGCGLGNTGTELNMDSYEEYTGVDISRVAIQKATERSGQQGRSHKNSFTQSDFSRFRPAGKYNVILFRDSLYYLPLRKIKHLLEQYSAYLVPGGVFIVRLWDGGAKKDGILKILERDFPVIERRNHSDPPAVVVIFKGLNRSLNL